jgi:hypothetical protein
VKIFLEILLSLLLHPIAMVLMWINVFGRTDLNLPQKLLWILVSIVWGIGPILYTIAGGGALW